jgi:hypothetical protein
MFSGHLTLRLIRLTPISRSCASFSSSSLAAMRMSALPIASQIESLSHPRRLESLLAAAVGEPGSLAVD